MLTAGLYHTLKINRISENGLYLVDDQGNEVLLPNRYVSVEHKVDDMLEVFVYHDSEDRIIATTIKPLAKVGDVAFLEVVDKTVHGAFMNWGLEAKDLFLPNRNQQWQVEVGKKYVVYLYTDNLSGRVVANTFLNGFIKNTDITVAPREEIDILVAIESPIGYRVVVNNKHWGMVYRNQIFRPISVGDRLRGFVSRITEDNRIDVSLQQQGYDQIKLSADKLLSIIEAKGGKLALNDNSAPEEVYKVTNMSKKTFKRCVGYLMKNSKISMDDNGIVILRTE